MHSILSFIFPGLQPSQNLKTSCINDSFPIIRKEFLQIRKQKDSNLITHSLVTVTVTLRLCAVSGSGVNTRDIVYVLIIFLMVR